MCFIFINNNHINGLGRNYSELAREQPIDVFLQNFFGQLDLPVSVDSTVTGVVNASFDATAQHILRDIIRAFGLVAYYDGAVVYVYSGNDLTRRILAVSPGIAERVDNTLRATPDGSLSITGVTRFIRLMEELVVAAQKVQAAQPPLGFKVFYLRYAWAQDITVNAAGSQLLIPGVASILRSLFSPFAHQSNTQYTAKDRRLSPRQPKLRGTGLASIGSDDMPGITDEMRRLNQFDLFSSEYRASGQPALANRSEEMLTPGSPNQVRIEADPRLNAVIVRDTFERMPHYEKLIESLDVEPQSLAIEATIIDINTDKLKELGINWRWRSNDNEALFGRGDNSDLRLAPDVNISPTGRGGVISLVLGGGNNFVARINALEAQGAATIVSNPQVLTLSNVEATFDVSSTAYVRVAGERDVDLFKISAGTTLRVTPHVFKRDDQVSIKLLVAVEDGNLTQESVDDIPIVRNSSINTQALIQAGESLLIGGMVRKTSEEIVNKVPILGSIPFLGALFRYKRTNTSNIERMFLISPRLTPKRKTQTVSMNTPFEDALMMDDNVVDIKNNIVFDKSNRSNYDSEKRRNNTVFDTPNRSDADSEKRQSNAAFDKFGRSDDDAKNNTAFDKFNR